MTQDSFIKCKFCDYKVRRFRTLKGGKKRGPDAAYQTLYMHIEHEHPSEWSKIGDYLDRLFEEEEEIEQVSTFS